jgi:hypothetical protein
MGEHALLAALEGGIFYTPAREIEAGAFLQDFPREATTITDQNSSASPATPRQLAILLIFGVFFMAPRLAHKMTSIKQLGRRRKRSNRWFHHSRIKCLLYCGFWVYHLPSSSFWRC